MTFGSTVGSELEKGKMKELEVLGEEKQLHEVGARLVQTELEPKQTLFPSSHVETEHNASQVVLSAAASRIHSQPHDPSTLSYSLALLDSVPTSLSHQPLGFPLNSSSDRVLEAQSVPPQLLAPDWPTKTAYS